MKDIREEIIKMYRGSKKLRVLSKGRGLSYKKIAEIQKEQDEIFKKHQFYKNFMDKKGELKNVQENEITKKEQ